MAKWFQARVSSLKSWCCLHRENMAFNSLTCFGGEQSWATVKGWCMLPSLSRELRLGNILADRQIESAPPLPAVPKIWSFLGLWILVSASLEMGTPPTVAVTDTVTERELPLLASKTFGIVPNYSLYVYIYPLSDQCPDFRTPNNGKINKFCLSPNWPYHPCQLPVQAPSFQGRCCTCILALCRPSKAQMKMIKCGPSPLKVQSLFGMLVSLSR
jgi:hypothetical protein